LVGGSTARFFQILLFGSLISGFSGRKITALASAPRQTDLQLLKDWLMSGTIAPLIDQMYLLKDLPSAIRQLEQRQVTGKVVVRV